MDIEGPEETFFNQPPPADVAAPPPAAAATTDEAQQQQQQGGGGNDEGEEGAEELPLVIVVATILTQMVTWLQQHQLPWSMATMNQLQRMCQLLLSTQTISSLAGSTVAFATVTL